MIVTNGENKRLDTYLAEELDISRSKVQKLIKEKLVTVNNKLVSGSYQVKENDVIELDNIKIEVVHAIHGYQPLLKGAKEIHENVGYIIDDGKNRLYTTSDTICFKNDYKADILCIPVTGHGLTMSAFEASLYAKEVGAVLTIPIHMDNSAFPPDFNFIKEMFEKYVPAEEVACIVIETIQGDGGLLEPVEGYFEALQDLCKSHGILLAVDDIQQGLGRTGKWSSVTHYNIEPDLITFGKSLAGGLPMSAIVGRAEIMDTLDAPAHLFTTGANPVSCEAALATISMIEDENLLQGSTDKGAYVRQRMDQWKERFESVGDVRGKGLSIGIDIVSDKKNKTRDGEAALKICNRCFDNGVVIIAVAENVLRFQPPLVITYEELDTALNILESAIEDLESGKLNDYDIAGQGW